MKHCKGLLKDEQQSPLFGKGERKNGISRAIYELVSRGIHGQVKKESVLQMLGELVVSNTRPAPHCSLDSHSSFPLPEPTQ